MLEIKESRRNFLQFLGLSAVGISAFSTCKSTDDSDDQNELISLPPTDADELILAEGFNAHKLISWQDTINNKGDTFGINNDYIATIKTKQSTLLWVNHEYPIEYFVSKFDGSKNKTAKQIELEQYSVGGSILELEIDTKSGWKVNSKSSLNRRLHANTKIPYANGEIIDGLNYAIGTLGNCAGGVTPWGTVLTAEENYSDYYGEVELTAKGIEKRSAESEYNWTVAGDRSPKQYGWITEVNLESGDAKKHVVMGRFAHEGAKVVKANNGNLVVYMGDDKADECFYKFVSHHKDSFKSGTLYVANVKVGKWIPLDINENDVLKQHFTDQIEVLIHCRKAAALAGGSKLHRPEGCDVHPTTKEIFLALTNHTKKGDYYGSLVKFVEDNSDHGSLSFKYSEYLPGGIENGFACPDNIIFDKNGNFWFTSDISGSSINKDQYKEFGNNALFFIPTSGNDAGKVFRIASAPKEAEFTGPFFNYETNTLFLSVQHPGEKSKPGKMTSQWNTDSDGIPRSAVFMIDGPMMNKILQD